MLPRFVSIAFPYRALKRRKNCRRLKTNTRDRPMSDLLRGFLLFLRDRVKSHAIITLFMWIFLCVNLISCRKQWNKEIKHWNRGLKRGEVEWGFKIHFQLKFSNALFNKNLLFQPSSIYASTLDQKSFYFLKKFDAKSFLSVRRNLKGSFFVHLSVQTILDHNKFIEEI